MPIEFRCPECKKLLRVPGEAAGAKAKCPQCGAIVDVVTMDTDSSSGPPSTASPRASEPDPTPQDTSVTSSSFSLPIATREPRPAKSSFGEEFIATRVAAGDVLSYAWEVWKSNLGILLGISLVAVGFDLVTDGIQNALSDGGDGGLAGLVAIVSFLIQTFIGIGYTQIVLKLLRKQPAAFGELFGGGSLYPRVLGATMIAVIAVILGVVACVVPAILLVIFFWPFHLLIVDRKAKAIESFRIANQIAKENIGTTIILIFASVGMVVVGVLALCVGLFLAAPLVSLSWGAAYLMMTGQMATRPKDDKKTSDGDAQEVDEPSPPIQ